MRCAVIDIGSNTVRMNVYDIKNNTDNDFPDFSPLFSEKETLGLVNYVRKGILTRDGADKLIVTLKKLRGIAAGVSADSVFFFATASLRNIANTEEITDIIAREAEIKIDVISGENEARFSFDGVMLALGGIGCRRGIMIDIGGGSTEILAFCDEQPKHAVSLPFGCLSLHKKYVNGILPDRSERKEIAEHAAKRIKNLEWIEDFSDCVYIVGGTGRAAAKIHREIFGGEQISNGYRIDSAALQLIYDRFAKPSRSDIRLMIKTMPDRLHTFIPGLEIALAAVEFSGAKKIIVSSGGVREGYLKHRFSNIALR